MTLLKLKEQQLTSTPDMKFGRRKKLKAPKNTCRRALRILTYKGIERHHNEGAKIQQDEEEDCACLLTGRIIRRDAFEWKYVNMAVITCTHVMRTTMQKARESDMHIVGLDGEGIHCQCLV